MMVAVGQSQQSLLFDQKYSVQFYFKTEIFNNISLFPLLLISLIRGCFGVKNNTRPRVIIFTECIGKISANIYQPTYLYISDPSLKCLIKRLFVWTYRKIFQKIIYSDWYKFLPNTSVCTHLFKFYQQRETCL